VPNVDAYFDYQAVEALRASGFQPNVVYEHRQGYIPKGVVWGPDPAIGTETPAGSTVTVYATPVDQPQVPTQGIQDLPVLPQAPIQPQTPQARFPI
jgi:beta-lactam-binding protein with PASTA domain